MSQALDLRDIRTLTDLQAALGRFADGAQEILRAAEAEIARTLEWLHARVVHWQREVEQARREVARAQAELRRCQASGYRDRDGHYHQPDCGHEALALARAEAHLRECEGHLHTAQAWRSRVEQAAHEYRHEARRLYDLAGGHTERARAFLEKTAARYEGVRATAHAIGSLLATAQAIGPYPTLTPATVGLLKTAVGRASLLIGQAGEDIAQSVTEDELGLQAVQFDQAKHGFDRILQGPSGQIMVLESKVNSEGKLVLDRTSDGHRQGSVGWVTRVAQAMTDPASALWSPDNERIGHQILEAGPENVRVLATVVNPSTGLADIYLRIDDAAEEWTLLSGEVPGGEEP